MCDKVRGESVCSRNRKRHKSWGKRFISFRMNPLKEEDMRESQGDYAIDVMISEWNCDKINAIHDESTRQRDSSNRDSSNDDDSIIEYFKLGSLS